MGLLDRISIKSKLIVMLLIVSGCSILVTAYIGYRSGKTNLTDRVFNQLTSVRASKAAQIQSYFKNIHNHIETLSENPSTIAAMSEFTQAYQQLQSEVIDSQKTAKISKYYNEEFLKRLVKSESGSPIVEFYTPKVPASQYLQYHYIANNPNPVGKKQLLADPKDGSEYSEVHKLFSV